jgi:hypothetical protein
MGLCYADGAPKEVFFPHLARPYPRVTAGELRSFHFDEASSVFTMEFDNRAGLAPAVEIHVNADLHYPDGFAVSSSDPEGAWSYSFDAAAFTLSVTCDPDSPGHVITVAPEAK